jgi:hypothetical protein
MARRKHRHGGRGFRIGKYVNLGFKILGAGIALSPAIKAVSDNRSNFQGIPAAVAANYTGLDVNTGALNWQQTWGGVAAVVGGIAVAKIGSFLGRRF